MEERINKHDVAMSETRGHVDGSDVTIDAGEMSPLTWQRDGLTDVMSPNTVQFIEMGNQGTSSAESQGRRKAGKKLKRKKVKSSIIYVSSDQPDDSLARSKLCPPKRKRPAYYIFLIAVVFFILLISVVMTTLYFAILRENPTIEIEYFVTIGNNASNTITTTSTPPTEATDTSRDITTHALHLTRSQNLSASASQFVPTSELVVSSSHPSLPPTSVTGQTTTTRPTTTLTTSSRTSDSHVIEETPPNIPIFFVEGPFTFEEAERACHARETKLALREDVKAAWSENYSRCSHGWLRDMHVAMLIQQQHANEACENGRVGAIIKRAQKPDTEWSGAFCVKDPGWEPTIRDMQTGSNPTKSVNWWVTADPMDAFNLRHALTSIRVKTDDVIEYPLMKSLKSLYLCCNIFNVSVTQGDDPVTFIDEKYTTLYLRKVNQIFRREMGPIRLYAHVSGRYPAMMRHGAATTNRTKTIESIVDLAASAGYDGIVFDYEPRENYTREHADVYRDFLDDLHIAMETPKLDLGTVISSWGILKYYDIFNKSKSSFFGSMSSTYYGHDIIKNKHYVTEMLKDINIERLEIGLGLMHMSEHVAKPRRNYRWQEEELREFVSWFNAQGVTRVHVYPGNWRSHKSAEEYFLQVLGDFSTDLETEKKD